MPGGTWWLPGRRAPATLYGDNFVIQRSDAGDGQEQGLVRVEGDAAIQPWVPPIEMGLVAIGQTSFRTALAVYRRGLPPEVVETDCSVVEEEWGAREGSACLAMVPLEAPGAGGEEGEREHPRRTGRVRFRCDRCGRVNVKAFNPLAWNYGAVLCRCEGCAVVHLLRDEKGVFGIWRRPEKAVPAAGLLGRLHPSIMQDKEWRSGGFELFDL
ncbi:unnamed protein product [Ostreobium quekettii]|uniref:DNL-type domain-containing protein n=1 Tax=Ostreobium quekettii TaxID=121088 RepID=A0A8S1IWI6_9CHLO|nr:unnamed protein product [Ostreobium quekettii]